MCVLKEHMLHSNLTYPIPHPPSSSIISACLGINKTSLFHFHLANLDVSRHVLGKMVGCHVLVLIPTLQYNLLNGHLTWSLYSAVLTPIVAYGNIAENLPLYTSTIGIPILYSNRGLLVVTCQQQQRRRILTCRGSHILLFCSTFPTYTDHWLCIPYLCGHKYYS